METKSGAGYKARFLGHVLFPKKLTGIDIGLLQFDQIEQGHTFVPASS